ncbi:MAG: ADP-ribosylation factor-like protein [Candidatus Thorarchaeota archaeon]|jgi:small GTP-binding protein
MIYSTILLNAKNQRKIASSEYWAEPIPRKFINQYLAQLESLIEKSERLKYKPVNIDEYKFISRDCGDGIIIFVTDLEESDEDVVSKINRAAKSLRWLMSTHSVNYVKSNYEKIMERFIQSQFVIALVGHIGVGKTSLLHLLMGKPPPETHVPTIAVNTEVIEDMKFANYELVIFDFAGREAAGKLWDFSFTDMVFLLTDSTLKNIIASKSIFTEILDEFPEMPIILLANKQDTPNSLDPTAISKVIGSDSYAMVAIDLAYRENLLQILVKALSDYFDVDIPDIPAEQLLCIEGEA